MDSTSMARRVPSNGGLRYDTPNSFSLIPCDWVQQNEEGTGQQCLDRAYSDTEVFGSSHGMAIRREQQGSSYSTHSAGNVRRGNMFGNDSSNNINFNRRGTCAFSAQHPNHLDTCSMDPGQQGKAVLYPLFGDIPILPENKEGSNRGPVHNDVGWKNLLEEIVNGKAEREMRLLEIEKQENLILKGAGVILLYKHVLYDSCNECLIGRSKGGCIAISLDYSAIRLLCMEADRLHDVLKGIRRPIGPWTELG